MTLRRAKYPKRILQEVHLLPIKENEKNQDLKPVKYTNCHKCLLKGQGPKKKVAFKQRMENKRKKKIKKAKMMGLKKDKWICVAIGQYLYYCKIINITIVGNIQVKYDGGNEEMYSLKNVKNMMDNGVRIRKERKEREERKKIRKFRYLIF